MAERIGLIACSDNNPTSLVLPTEVEAELNNPAHQVTLPAYLGPNGRPIATEVQATFIFYETPFTGSQVRKAFIATGDPNSIRSKPAFDAAQEIFNNGHVNGTVYQAENGSSDITFHPIPQKEPVI